MEEKDFTKFFRLLAYLFDLAFVVFFFFIYLFYPVGLLNAEIISQGYASGLNIFLTFLGVLLAGITISLYFFIPLIFFKGSTFGMKIFYIRLMKDEKTLCTNKILLKRSFIIFLFLLLSFGLSLISDIITIIFSSSNRTFSDVLSDVKIVKLNYGKDGQSC